MEFFNEEIHAEEESANWSSFIVSSFETQKKKLFNKNNKPNGGLKPPYRGL